MKTLRLATILFLTLVSGIYAPCYGITFNSEQADSTDFQEQARRILMENRHLLPEIDSTKQSDTQRYDVDELIERLYGSPQEASVTGNQGFTYPKNTHILIFLIVLFLSVIVTTKIATRQTPKPQKRFNVKLPSMKFSINPSKFFISLWVIGTLVLVLYVPYANYSMGSNILIKTIDVVYYDWIFKTHLFEDYGEFTLINYQLLILQIVVWSAITVGPSYYFKKK